MGVARFLQTLFVHLLLLVILSVAAVLLCGLHFWAAAADVPPAVVLGADIASTVVLWWIGLFFAREITHSPDLALFALVPLTPARYFAKNVRRVAVPLLLIYAVTPAVFAAVCRPSVLGDVTVALDPFALSVALTFLLMFLIPLYERLAPRPWTRFFFLPRVLVLALWHTPARYLIWPCGLLFLFVGRIRDPVFAALHDAEIRLVGDGLVGQLLYYLLLPCGSMWHFAGVENPPQIQWALPAVLAALTFLVLRSLSKWWHLMPHAIEEENLALWLDHREQIEEHEETAYRERESLHRPLSHFHHDGFAEGEGAEPAAIREPQAPLAYETARAPEEQLLRHTAFWEEAVSPTPRPRWLMLLQFLERFPWLALVLVGWAVCLYIRRFESPNPLRQPVHLVILLVVFTFLLWMTAVMWAERSRATLVEHPTLGLRWPAFAWAVFRASLGYLLVADGLAALLFSVAAELPLWSAPLFLAAFLMLRAALAAGVWIKFCEEAGHKSSLLLYYLAVSLTLLASIILIVMVIALAADYPGSHDWEELAPLVMAPVVGMIFLFLVTGLATLLQWLRTRSQVVVRPPLPPSYDLPDSSENE